MKKLLILSQLVFVLLTACKKDLTGSSQKQITDAEKKTVEHSDSVISLSLPDFGRAWVWYNGVPGPAPLAYQFNFGTGLISVSRSAVGSYQVTIPNLGPLYAGITHAVAYGGNHTAQVQNWSSSGVNLIVNIKCFGPTGALVDGKFVAFFYKESGISSVLNSAYLWSNSTFYSYNSRGLRNTLTRSGTGVYSIRFPGLLPNINTPGERGNVFVTPYGSVPRRCQIVGWTHDASGISCIVNTRDFSGNLADATFTISYTDNFNIGQMKFGEDTDYGAYVKYDLFTTPSLHYQKVNWSHNPITVFPTGTTGSNKVVLPPVSPTGTYTMVMASSFGTDKSYVSVQNWVTDRISGKTTVTINRYDSHGSPMSVPSKFTLFFYTNENILF